MTSSDTARPRGTGRAAARSALGALVLVIFFLSGATSLVYQVVWVRKFGLVFGVTTYAVSTVLASFFAGLAIGSYIAGRLIDRTRVHPLRAFAAMEVVIGAYALLLPAMLGLLESFYPVIYARVGENFSLFTLVRFAVSFALLLIPTILMGATLPVLAKLMVDKEDVLGLNAGRLYSVNTFGAVAGTFACGFLLVPALGVPLTTLSAALTDFVLAAASVALSVAPAMAPVRRLRSEERPQDAPKPLPLTRIDRAVLFLSFASGIAILALEVVWARSLQLILGSTTYAFSTMLTAVLLGIATGSAVFAPIADRSRNRGALVGGLFFGSGLFAALGPGIINRLPFVFLRLTDVAMGSWEFIIVTQFIVCFMLVFVPTFLSGACFPVLVKMYSRGEENVGRTVADIFASDTLGGILGSLLGGFVLVKLFGLQPALTASALFLMLTCGPLAVWVGSSWPRSIRASVAGGMIALVALLGFLHPRFDTKLLFAGWGPFAGGYYVSRHAGSTVDVTHRYMQRLLYHKEGVSASVDVLEDGWGDRIISVNAQPVATTYLYDMRTLKMLGHLPLLLHPEPRDVLLIGMGAGVSSGIMGIYPSVDSVTVVELSEEVPGGAAKFSDWNFNVLQNPKVNVVINDGANYVKAVTRQYDVISSDPIHPFISGNGILYSYEHWKISKDRLREGGVLAQWLPLYQLSPTDFATIIGTFVDVFPNATMWFCGIDTVLIGAKGDLSVDIARMGEHMSDPVVMRDLLSMGVHSPADVLGWYVAGPREMRDMGLGAPRNRVEYPVLEFTAPKSVTLAGIASTVPALLTAIEQLQPHEYRRQLTGISVQPLDSQALLTAATQRLANRWLMRQQLLISYQYADQSLNAALQALALRPNDTFVRRAVSDAQTAVGENRLGDGYAEEAYEYFRDAYANDPSNLLSLTGAVRAALQLADHRRAETALSLASPDQRDKFQYLVFTGLVALRRQDFAAAQAAFEQASERGQESPLMHVGLGFLSLRSGRRDEADAHFLRALQTATHTVDPLYDIIDVCHSNGFTADARPYAEMLVTYATMAIAADPGLPSLYSYRALAYTVMGEQALADRDLVTHSSLTGWWTGDTTSAAPALGEPLAMEP